MRIVTGSPRFTTMIKLGGDDAQAGHGDDGEDENDECRRDVTQAPNLHTKQARPVPR